MPTQTYNFPDIKFGDTHDGTSFTVLVNAVALNLTAASIKAQFRANSSTGALLKTMVDGVDITITDAVNGVFQIDPFDVDIPPGVAVYDIELTLGDGRKKTYIGGTWCILQDVTQ